ncbi:hypothetical protein [Candidatus Nitrosocosmicus arcticus]|uniref:hypothetical protein n=1 Tax=Candidatus Nitrosocosmicus arcticus TaxID=2035267 RepID=UPI0011A6A5DA|nr:hypothetical protein [Candidatus Nitrosocosmicus arcticus]
MSIPDPEPKPMKLPCSNCKTDGGDFWTITPDLPYTLPSREKKVPSHGMPKTLITTSTCPLCNTVNAIYWDVPTNPRERVI